MIRVGLVGAGGMAERHAKALCRDPHVRVVTVLDRDRSRARDLAGSLGARDVQDVEEALATVDAVIVATPPRGRLELIRAAAAAGVAVFCEKPLAVELAEGAAIVEVVEESGIPFMMGFCLRFAAPMKRLHSIVAGGVLGDLVSLSRTRMGWLQHRPDNWRVDAAQRCGMAVESVSHEFDLLRWLGGEIAFARGEVASAAGLAGYDDNVAATVRFASGAIGSVQASWHSRVEYNAVSVVGTSGTAVLSGPGMWTWERLDLSSADAEWRETFSAEDAADMGWSGEIVAFLDALRSGAPPPTGARDGMAALTLSHGVLNASRTVASAGAVR